MGLVFIFCIPLLHNIIHVNCLTLYEYASVKVISFKKKMTPHLTPCAELGHHSTPRTPRRISSGAKSSRRRLRPPTPCRVWGNSTRDSSTDENHKLLPSRTTSKHIPVRPSRHHNTLCTPFPCPGLSRWELK